MQQKERWIYRVLHGNHFRIPLRQKHTGQSLKWTGMLFNCSRNAPGYFMHEIAVLCTYMYEQRLHFTLHVPVNTIKIYFHTCTTSRNVEALASYGHLMARCWKWTDDNTVIKNKQTKKALHGVVSGRHI